MKLMSLVMIDLRMFSKLSKYFNVLSEESISECTVLPPLQSVKRNKLMHIVNCVNLCQFIDTSDLRSTADLMYAAAKVVTEAVGLSCQRGSSTPDYANPLWKLQLQNKLAAMQRDLSRLVAMQCGNMKSHNTVNTLATFYSKYLSNGSPLTVVIESLHLRIAATSRKIACYAARTEGFYQNKLFAADQHKFYTYLSSAAKDNTAITPNDEDVVKFWTSLRGGSRIS